MATNYKMISSSWKEWIKTNLDRGCDPSDMIDILIKETSISLSEAKKLIDGTDDQVIRPENISKKMPIIDLNSSVIQIDNTKINIIATFKTPFVAVLDNILSNDECDHLVSLCSNKLIQSSVINNDTGKTELHPGRTSVGSYILRNETPIVRCIEERLARLANWPIENSEGLQIQQYRETNEYCPHYDWFDTELEGTAKHLKNGGQRLGTFILYLSDVVAGGKTIFPKIGLEVFPKKGNAVFFLNTDVNHCGDKNTLHAGSPVITGCKTIANKWLRAEKYQ